MLLSPGGYEISDSRISESRRHFDRGSRPYWPVQTEEEDIVSQLRYGGIRGARLEPGRYPRSIRQEGLKSVSQNQPTVAAEYPSTERILNEPLNRGKNDRHEGFARFDDSYRVLFTGVTELGDLIIDAPRIRLTTMTSQVLGSLCELWRRYTVHPTLRGRQ